MEPAHSAMTLSGYSDEPVYNVKAVCMRTGITAATLRAWERRYGVPTPKRSVHGYRLYSDRDIAIIAWLLQQIENGINIGQAIIQLNNMLASGNEPSVRVPQVGAPPLSSRPRSPELLARELVDALTALDETHAENILNEAVALYTIETTLISILRAAVEIIRVQRDRHEVSILAERFAGNYARQRLRAMMQSAQSPRRSQPLVTVGFPGEHNEIDLLIISLLLGRHGWAVTHLGTDLEPSLLKSALDGLKPAVFFYYVDQPENGYRLTGFDAGMYREDRQPTWLVCGGKAIQIEPSLRNLIPFEYLGSDLRAIVRALSDHMSREFGNAGNASRRERQMGVYGD